MSQLKKILARKEERKKKLARALSSAVAQLKGWGAEKIILFGSSSRGDIDTHSDLDILVIMPEQKTGKEWMRYIYENIEKDVASDILAYNEPEFEENLPKSSFLSTIVKSGRVVYEKTT